MSAAGQSTLPGQCLVCDSQLGAAPRRLAAGPPVVGGAIRPCPGCESAQVSPLPTPEQLAGLYSGDYYAQYAEGPGMAGGDDEVAPYLRQRLTRMAKVVGTGRLLDLGCGTGVFVAYARSMGWAAVGLETSKWASAAARQRHGIEVIDRPLEEAEVAPGSFDVIHANHVLEHLLDPIKTLRAAARVLRPGGLLIAEVPQEFSAPFAERIVGRLRPPTGSRVPNYHVLFFSRRGCKVAAERAAFRVTRIINVRHRAGLRTRSLPMAVARELVFRSEELTGRAPAYVLEARTADRG